ncbi:MAG: phage major capsid protein, partial [Erysipelotrichaceae bacterium]|nr:phage major capsid protein [Erysipelotrichaceae bacterium]
EELQKEDADIDALTAEVEELEARKAQILKEVEERKALLEEVEKTAVEIEEKPMEERKVEIEVRNTKEYALAFAKYIRSEDDKECRALLTENGSGTVSVPEFVHEEVKTAWNEDGIMSRVRKSYLKGNLKVGFEISATGAVKHTEGQAVNEQTLVMGIVQLVPVAIKKWISISDEALDLDNAESYLRFIYRELAHHIAAAAAKELIDQINAAPTASTATAVGVAKITATQVTLGLVASAIAQLSDQAANPVVMMNKLTYAAFKQAQYAASYPVDPFEGCDVVFNENIAALSAATTGVTWAIVGDLGYGALANFPNGEEIQIKRDDYTLAASDLVRFIGREFVGIGPVAPGAFVKIGK